MMLPISGAGVSSHMSLTCSARMRVSNGSLVSTSTIAGRSLRGSASEGFGQGAQHALQRKVAVTVQRELADFLLVHVTRDVELDPAVVGHVLRKRIALIAGEHALTLDTHPEREAELVAPRIGLSERLLAGLPHREAEHLRLRYFRKLRADPAQRLEHGLRALRLQW